MSSETSMVAAQCRLQEWAAQIRECQSRPADMRSVAGWCACHGITKANYYYRLRRVREACLESYSGEMPHQQIVPITQEILLQEKDSSHVPHAGLDISIKGFSIHLEEASSMSLLAKVLEVMLNVATCFKAVYIVCGYTDLRSGMDCLAALIEAQTGNRSYVPDTLYLFSNRKNRSWRPFGAGWVPCSS